MFVRTKVYSKDAVLVLAASFFYMSCPMIVTPIIAGFTGALGGAGFLMGFIGGLVNLVSLVCRPAAGNLADKMDEYRMALLGSGLMVIGCIGYCVTPSVWILVLARVVNGAGYACCSVSMSTWLSILLPKDKIGAGMGLYGTVQALSMAAAPALGIRLQGIFGYRAVFFVAVMFALVTILITLQIKNHGTEARDPDAPKRKGIQIVDPKVLPIALIVMLFTIPYLAAQSFLISLIVKKNIPVNTALFFPVYAVVLVALRAGLRNYFDRVPYRRFLFLSIISSILALLSLNFMTSNVLLLSAAVFMAGGYGIMCSVSQAGAIMLAGPGKRGIANSTYYVGIDLGAALGAVIGGILYGCLDVNLFFLVFLVCPVCCVITYFAFRKNLDSV